MPCTTQADMYSLGVLLTVLLTGRLPANRGQLQLPRAPDDCPQARGRERLQGQGDSVLRKHAGSGGEGLHSIRSCKCCPDRLLPLLMTAMQAVVELVRECILPDPQRRPTAAEALQRLEDS